MNERKLDGNSPSDWFWSIIDHADRSREKLATILNTATEEEVQRFEEEFESATYNLWHDDVLHYLRDLEKVSEDGLLTVFQWVVSQGKVYYSDILANPHRIPQREEIDLATNLVGIAEMVSWIRFRK